MMKFWDRTAIAEKPIDLEHEIFRRPTIVILLGAGASKDAGFPICADLKSAEFVSPFLSAMTAEAQRAFEWLKDQEDSFEILLSHLMEAREGSKVADMLAFYEEIFLRAESESAQSFDRWAYLFKLVIYVASNSMGWHPVFVTFNHDLVLEYAGTEEINYNYGTLTNKMYCRANQKHPVLHKPGYDYTILKLHGSFNMLVCDKCERIMSWDDYTWQWKESPCSACDSGTLFPLYIPPTPFKTYDPLRVAWVDARSALKRAVVVLVIGYSLPEYDQHAVTLLSETNPGATLYIVDKYAAYTAPRYAQFPPRAKLFKSISAKEFCEELFDGNKLGSDFLFLS